MSTYTVSDTRKVTTKRFQEMKDKGENISMLTSYDYTMASLVDQAGIDAILVGDSASNVMAGNTTTLPMTLDQMIYHAKSVTKAVKRALVVVDMPFGSYQGNPDKALENAVRIMKETGADALKLEGALKSLMPSKNPGCRNTYLWAFGSYASEHQQIRNLYCSGKRKRRSRKTPIRRKDIVGSRMFCDCH